MHHLCNSVAGRAPAIGVPPAAPISQPARTRANSPIPGGLTWVGRATAVLGLFALCVGIRAQPTVDLQAVVQSCQAEFDQRPTTVVIYSELVGAWVKRQYKPVVIDVHLRKAGSTVTQYVAQLDITDVVAAHSGGDEASVRALDVSPDDNVMRSVHRIHLAFQGGAWVAMGGTSSVDVRRTAGEDFSRVNSVRRSPRSLMVSGGPIASCLGQTIAGGGSAPHAPP